LLVENFQECDDFDYTTTEAEIDERPTEDTQRKRKRPIAIDEDFVRPSDGMWHSSTFPYCRYFSYGSYSLVCGLCLCVVM